jgi:hypothetical protein
MKFARQSSITYFIKAQELVQLPFVESVSAYRNINNVIYTIFTNKKHILNYERSQIDKILEGLHYELKYIGQVNTEEIDDY